MSEKQFIPNDGLCSECGGPTRPLMVPNNPASSEFYCSKCRKSFLVSDDLFSKFEQMRKQNMMQNRAHGGNRG